jgi:hypothetical protein
MEPVFMLMWATLLTKFEGNKRSAGFDGIQLQHMAQLGGPSVTLTSLKRELDRISLSLKISAAIGVALFGVLIAAILRWFKPQ